MPFEDLLFFDDEPKIIREGISLGVQCVCVEGTGLNVAALEEGLLALASR